jgi:hypothetical protein
MLIGLYPYLLLDAMRRYKGVLGGCITRRHDWHGSNGSVRMSISALSMALDGFICKCMSHIAIKTSWGCLN